MNAKPTLGPDSPPPSDDGLPAPPPRPDDGHKGTFGTVVVVGGSVAMPGAPALCARSAFRAGAGLVKIASDLEVLATALTITPSATGIGLTGDAPSRLSQLRAALDNKAVLAVGPGLGQDDRVKPLVMPLLAGDHAVVLDADGLNALARSGERLAGRDPAAPLVLTPHPGEFRRLAEPLGITADPTDPAQRPDAAAQLAAAHDAVVLLKGRHTVISDGERVYTNNTGNPALATAGTGDVLTGLLAALLAQGMNAFDAACLSAHAHGLAADRWARRHGMSGLLATELADELPDTFEFLRTANVPF